jgi:cellulose synthase/poly-beta-1,6-N-acetylglucosamine synthase-like glycosyltransferase
VLQIKLVSHLFSLFLIVLVASLPCSVHPRPTPPLPPPPPSYNHCTPLTLQTAFDILLADAFMCVFWVVGELLIKSFDLELKDEIDGGKAFQKRMDAAEKAQHMVLPEDRRKNVRHSPEWNEQIKGWKERQKLQKKVAGLNNWARAYGFYFFFWVLFVLSQYLVCITAPKVKSYSRQYGMPIYYVTLFRQMLSPSFAGPYDYIIWSVVFLEAVLFFMAAAVVTWPKPPLIRGVESNANTDFYKQSGIGTDNLLKVKPRDFFKKGTGIVQLLEDEHGGLIQDTCLLIACHMSTLTPERTHTFSATVKSALRVFPAHAIFVCDNGPWQHPLDRTDKVCTQISRDHDPSGQTNINYLYIPEGNKSHAMYWATEYWIPELVRRGELQEYQFALMIDDDVPLPPDLHVPNNTLNRNPAIKACAYVIQAATEDGKPNNLVSVQDLEYKMAGFIKQFQFTGGTTVCCHGAIALWRRDVLGSKILWDHDTVFHGEGGLYSCSVFCIFRSFRSFPRCSNTFVPFHRYTDCIGSFFFFSVSIDLYMGLLLHRMRANYGIMVSASAVVPTFAPERL